MNTTSNSGDDNELILLQLISKQLDIMKNISASHDQDNPLKPKSAEIIDSLRDAIDARVQTVILATDGARIDIEQVGVKEIGDTFTDIGEGAVIVNRSSLSNCINKIRSSMGADAADALGELADIVIASSNVTAIENFNALSEELEKPHPRRGVLKSFWMGIITELPTATVMVSLNERISRLFLA